ncbi:unnamed protein product, partial [Rotaria magnacalcarata]
PYIAFSKDKILSCNSYTCKASSRGKKSQSKKTSEVASLSLSTLTTLFPETIFEQDGYSTASIYDQKSIVEEELSL